MEEENKKLRKRVRREFMERVRALASHIKRRDPRIAEMQRIAREEEAAAQAKREAEKLRYGFQSAGFRRVAGTWLILLAFAGIGGSKRSGSASPLTGKLSG
eukprot:scaffold518_cov388-Prasinococcus_capsulatus_cf.AAC.69